MADYSRVAGQGLSFAGVDQGIDFTGAGDLFAPAKILITRVEASGSGWPGQGAVVAGKLLDGPKAGQYVYFAEDLAPTVQRGQVYPAGHVVAKATGTGQAPGVEIGFAQPNGSPLAPRPAPRPAPQFTQIGAQFLGFVTGSGVFTPGGGVTPGTGPVDGKVPDPNAAVTQPVKDAYNATLSTAKFLGRLSDPSYLLRGGQLVAGAVLILTGVVMLLRQVALAADLPMPPAGAAIAGAVA